MRRSLTPRNLRPKSGFSHLVHLGLTILLPLILYVLVRIDFSLLAALFILISKWRMFAVRPRYWLANIRANGVDVMVGLSVVVFMSSTPSGVWQLVWVVLYGLWLVFLKPGSSLAKISLQAVVGQFVGLMALFLAWGDASMYLLVIMSWIICYLAARHFFTSFDEPYTALYAHTWAYFAAALTWLLSHWLLFYGVLAQPTLLLTVIGYGLAALYYLEHTDRLSILLRRQFIFIMVAVVVVVLVFSDWVDKAI